jgi:hypothetical protein
MAEKKLKKYLVSPSQSDVYAISIVDQPAIESNFIALAKQEKPMKFKIQSEEKRMLYGSALRADFPIYRCYDYGNDLDEFYVEFSADAIRRLMVKFMKNYSQKNWTKDHMDFAEGLTVVESWIVEDPERDKANVLGLTDFGKGDWMIGVKVDDDELWHSIKEGRWHGFSVEAFVDLKEQIKEIKNNSDIKMSKSKINMDELLDSIKGIIEDAVEKADGQDAEVQEEAVEQAAEEVADAVEATEEEETTEKETVEAEEEATPEEQIAEDVIEQVEDNAETTEDAADDLQAVVDQLQQEVDDLKKENEELKKKNEKMAKQPSTKKVEVKQSAVTGFNPNWRESLATVYKMN